MSNRLVLLLLSWPLLAAAQSAPPRVFGARDLVTLERISAPRLSPDGTQVAYELRQVDYDANKASTGLWWLRWPDVKGQLAEPRRLTAPGVDANTPRWSADGKALYFLSSRSGSSQVWRLDLAGGGEAQPVTHAPLDINEFVLTPDGQSLVVSVDVFPDCDTLECTHARLMARAAQKSSGQLYSQLFVRHWSTWADGTRSQLFAYALNAQGVAGDVAPRWLTRGIDGDVPSKPYPDDRDIAVTPDGRAVIFSVRIAGRTEPWSTHFDLYRVPIDGSAAAVNLTPDNRAWARAPVVSPDGRTLAYLQTRRPGYESDRFGVMLMDLGSGRVHELAPGWDRSADSPHWSADARTLYVDAEDQGQTRIFAIDAARGSVSALTGDGTVADFDTARGHLVYAFDTLGSPAQLFALQSAGHALQLTHVNDARLAGVPLGQYQQFHFTGWNNEEVYGYVMKPAHYQPGHKYPVAFIIHGGPESPLGNQWHYRWNMQTYAGAGYAVVDIEFHGTPGYGQAFTDSINQHWGDRPLEDLQKGWAYVLAHYDFLDGADACALGASYGGYMIYWIAGNWPTPASGAWKCLVAHDGVFDTRAMYLATDELWFENWEHGGSLLAHPENYERFNPLNHVNDWQVPLLVVQGGQDFRIPSEQGLSAFTVLQERNIPSQLLYFPDENHWVLKPQNSVQWHDTVEAWLKRWTTPAH